MRVAESMEIIVLEKRWVVSDYEDCFMPARVVVDG